MPCDGSQTPTWDAEQILDISYGCERCSCTTLKGLRCRNPINASNRLYSKIILAQIPSVSKDPERLYGLLQALADCLLCVRYHRKDLRQWIVVIGRWLRSIQRANEEEPTRQDDATQSSTTESEDLGVPEYADASTQTSHPLGQTEPCEDRVKEEKLQRESERRDEAKRQSQRERERQQAEARARAEEEAHRQEAREQAAREADRRRAERRQRDQARENVEWEVSWQSYDLQWTALHQLPSDTSPTQLIKLMPRPVCGASPENLHFEDPMFAEKVEAFFKNMPETSAESVASRMMLRKKLKFGEMLRWHSDKIMQRFPHLRQEDDALKLVNRVTQVLTRLLSTL
ncbi:hypothetical protein Slin15195_G024620 [Septoria linicola]|uniref:Uncharacterized protein n=1 Tax=Septoria linicola TaxID=215465 RepID=A0A9Q9EHB4_9PEZI|nr:hypothetical protein Slin14017_G023710 [Septoria linicola]USW49143.1 hypothetical protein Slin15195_G024620 [Septoria linicola]